MMASPAREYGRFWNARPRVLSLNSRFQKLEEEPQFFDEKYGENFSMADLEVDLSKVKNENNASRGWFELDLSSVGLRSLSIEIRNYSHLTCLYLNNNKIEYLPEEIFSNLVSLCSLDLSYNLLTRLPHSIITLMQIQKLYLTENQLTELPIQMGRFYRLKDLSILGNPIINPPQSVLQMGTESVIQYLRDRLPTGPPPPERILLSLIDPATGNPMANPFGSNQISNSNSGAAFEKDLKLRVISYNILANSYANTGQYGYCPAWALDWGFRSQGIMKELLRHEPDVICLQEVEAGTYKEFFVIELGSHGYSGVFTPKSRARTMDDWTVVDGCATFYKRTKFNLAEEVSLEFQGMAMSKHKELGEDPDAFSRLITKDNIASIAVLQIKEDPPLSVVSKGPKYAPKPKHILIANTHIHWNPEFRDVKLLQVQFLLEQLSTMTSPKSKWNRIPMVICGDFNSMPDSGPYELLSTGKIAPKHEDLEPFYYGSYSQGMKHPFSLSSAYSTIGEPIFTNYTGDFFGCLDYIWYTTDSLGVSKILTPVEEERVKDTRLPNAFMNSDHISILAEFMVKKRN
eukprot:TRINITY_DN4371_c0_g1_i1.p1 TRINITY_DN4371_c0_g1~~TRINITY_DN4371_c0_g1_i1.p1  ORF type:complete len:573 (-),score=168.28 TRINITY_DN4371_c0_g1_i1:90-1808(-)